MQDIAYSESNAFLGLGCGTVYLLIYFINVFIVVILVIYIFIARGKCGGKMLLKKMKKVYFLTM